jgi:nucleotide-binding universal stress UspA family protein
MDCYLIVANQTLGGAELEEIIRDRIELGHGCFHIVVPMVAPHLEAAGWVGTDTGMIIPDEEAFHEARRRSEHRLAAIIDKIRAAGGTATGEVGDPDPARAVKQVLAQRAVDEVIVSTLPAGISRWLKMDLPSRISRLAPVPVTIVEAER